MMTKPRFYEDMSIKDKAIVWISGGIGIASYWVLLTMSPQQQAVATMPILAVTGLMGCLLEVGTTRFSGTDSETGIRRISRLKGLSPAAMQKLDEVENPSQYLAALVEADSSK